MAFKERMDLLKKHLSPLVVTLVFCVVFTGLALDSILSAALGATTAPVSQGFELVLSLVLDAVFAGLITAALVVLVGTWVVARVTGPLERSHGILKGLAHGDMSKKLRLEKGQLLETYSEDLNFAIATLREYVAEDRFRLQHAAEMLRSLAREHPEAYDDIQDLITNSLSKVTAKLLIEEGDPGPDLSTDATGVYRGLKRQNA